MVILWLVNFYLSPLAFSLTEFIAKYANQIKFDWFESQSTTYDCTLWSSLQMVSQPKIVQLFGHSARSMCALVRQKSPYKWSTIQISWEEREKSQPKPTVRSLCTFHVCGTLHCVPWCVKKVLGVRQYVHTFGPPGVFYNVLLPASINTIQSVHFIYLLSLSIS